MCIICEGKNIEGLEVLYCSKNQLTVLPKLSQGLTRFHGNNNPLEPPFDDFVAKYHATHVSNNGINTDNDNAIKELKTSVNGYYENIK